MMRMLTAATGELDNINDAVDEILDQFNLAGNLLKNAAAVIARGAECVGAGKDAVVGFLCKRPPFNTAGMTQGGAVSGPYGPEISLSGRDYNGIPETAENTPTRLLADNGKKSCAPIYTCLSRTLIPGSRSNAATEKTAEITGDNMPYQICCSGGEYCPVKNAEDMPVNHAHNFTFIEAVPKLKFWNSLHLMGSFRNHQPR
jgi:hypothetical protein